MLPLVYSLSYTLQVILIDSVKGKEEEEEESLDVVHAALSAIIGDDPTEEQKLSPEVILKKSKQTNKHVSNHRGRSN